MIVWKEVNVKYGHQIKGTLGKIKVFVINWNSCRCRGDTDNEYVLVPLLPGFKEERYYGPSTEFLKERADAMLDTWVDAAGLQVRK